MTFSLAMESVTFSFDFWWVILKILETTTSAVSAQWRKSRKLHVRIILGHPMTPFPWASTVTNGSAKAKSQLSGWRDPFPWTDPSLTGPGSELFTCLSVPPSGGGWQRGGAIPVPEGMGSNGPITAKPDRGDWPWRCPLAVWSSQL